jgi:hypothetical protein
MEKERKNLDCWMVIKLALIGAIDQVIKKYPLP